MSRIFALAAALCFANNSFIAGATAQTRPHAPQAQQGQAQGQAQVQVQVQAQARPVASQSPLEAIGIHPYAHAGEGDDDGLSRDPDDCNKGCIGGNPD